MISDSVQDIENSTQNQNIEYSKDSFVSINERLLRIEKALNLKIKNKNYNNYRRNEYQNRNYIQKNQFSRRQQWDQKKPNNRFNDRTYYRNERRNDSNNRNYNSRDNRWTQENTQWKRHLNQPINQWVQPFNQIPQPINQWPPHSQPINQWPQHVSPNFRQQIPQTIENQNTNHFLGQILPQNLRPI